MATCPECDAEIEVDEFDVDKGDLISCPDCGSNLEVTSIVPGRARIGRRGRRRGRGRRRRGRRRGRRRRRRSTTTTTPPRTSTSDRRSAGERPADARRRGRPRSHPARRGGPLPRPARISVGPRGLQRRRRLRLSCMGRARAFSAPRALCVTADSPSYPERHRQLARPRRARVRLQPRDHPRPREIDRAEYRANPGEPLLLLQARALHAARRARARARHCRSSPTAAMPTTAATTAPAARRRASSASAVRSTRPA